MSRELAVLVVAYGRPDLLDQSLAGLAGAFRVEVVDNSSDPAVREVCGRHGAAYTDAGANRGFGAGVNLGLRRLLDGPPADVLLLNPDAVIGASGVRRLAEAFTDIGGERIGMVTPSVFGADGVAQRVVWPFPSPRRAWAEAIGLGRWNRAPDFAVGTVLLLRWEALRDVGGFDEAFFLYAEETDWQRRARDLGWRPRHVGDVTAVHVGAATSADPRRRESLFHAGTETYLRKWHGPAGWQAYRGAVIVGAAVRAVVLPRAAARVARQRALLYLRGPRRVAGLKVG